MKAIRSYLLRPTIPVVMIRKRISEDTALSIRRHLTDKALGKAKAIAIVVDSRGGDLPQTQIVAKKLQILAQKHHLPIYGFIDGDCVQQPYFLLSATANQIYANKHSIIGFRRDTYMCGFSKILSKYLSIKTRSISSTNGLVDDALNPLQNNPKDKLIEQTDRFKQELQDWSLEFRQAKLKNKKFEPNDVFTGQQAEKNGLIDGLGTYQAVLSAKYPGCLIKPIHYSSFVQIMKHRVKYFASPTFVVIAFIICLKAFIKYLVILYVWATKSNTDQQKTGQKTVEK